MAEFFRLDGVIAGYGNAPVLHGIDLEVPAGRLAVVLGANGVGKTTMVRSSTGLVRPWKGSVHLDGARIDHLSPDQIVRHGIAVVPEPPGVFTDLTVIDNLRVGGFGHPEGRSGANRRVEELFDHFPRLRDRRHQIAGSLSGGERRLLALARALMSMPRLLLVDEASMGLFPAMIAEVLSIIGGLRDRGLTVCMVEQNVAALDVADMAFVMQKGRIVHAASGDMGEVRARVGQTYLGSQAVPAS